MLREVELTKNGALKLKRGLSQLYFGDLQSNIKSYTPGQWVYFNDKKSDIKYIGFLNPLVQNSYPCAHMVSKSSTEVDDVESFLFSKIKQAINKRNKFNLYDKGARLIYGFKDFLPGLVVDSYINYILIQINTAGIDSYRSKIKVFFEELYPEKKVHFVNKQEDRLKEGLPFYEDKKIEDDLEVLENGYKFIVQKDVLQKVGYYYDHRENRRRAASLIKTLDMSFDKGLDLFSYVGSWGIQLLGAGCENINFVDQGDFEQSVNCNLENNNLKNNGKFIRENVFTYLKQMESENVRFNLICSDPPAFCKSKKEARKAYEGYLKLHRQILKVLSNKALFIACSCTQYINHADFERNIIEAANKESKQIQLLDVGMQGFDHPTDSLNNQSTYLKYYAYLVE